VELLGADAAGLMLADRRGQLRVMASTNDQARLLELSQLQQQGPCLECHRDGCAVLVRDLAESERRWPRFAPTCREAGFAAVSAIPLRCRDEAVGAMNLFQRAPGGLDPASVRIAQALSDVATIGLLQQRAMGEQGMLIEQLQTALTSRVIIEQAKGMLAERTGSSTEQAFAALRLHARAGNHRLTDLARAVIDGTAELRL
jgi:hypothetical protein